MRGTLFITGDPEADGLLNRDGTALMIGMLLDQQVPMEVAFRGPATLTARLGHLDAGRIAAMSEDDFVAVCCERPAIHRFPAVMARRIHALCIELDRRYGGRAEAVWADVTSADELYRRLRALPGFGDEKARIFIALLGKRMGVQPDGWRDAAGKFGEATPRSVADSASPETLADVRTWKRAQKAAALDKQDRPLPATSLASRSA
jgi:uncharacterized HhH-GPD family protein